MDANNPDTDGSMAPNIDPAYLNHPNYESGGFYAKTNRYAAIHRNPPIEPPPADPVVPHVQFDGIAPVPKRLNRAKVINRYGIRVRHRKIPASSPYHQAYTEGTDDRGNVRLRLDPNRIMGVGSDYASEPDINNLDPVTPEPDELHNLNRYSDLLDRNTGEGWAFDGYDPSTDMVRLQDPESGNEHWLPRRQLIAKYHPNDPYSHRVMPIPPVQDGTYQHGEIK